MATTTRRDILQARLDAYLAAETKILKRQEYVIGEGATARRLRYADLGEVREQIETLTRQLDTLDAQAAGTRRVLYMTPAR